MAKQRKSSGGGRGPKKSTNRPRAGGEVRARKTAPGGGSGEAWELVHPRCAKERSDDLEEVQAMLDAGEVDIAIDELRWLLSGCSDFMQAHVLLGTLALSEDRDLRLARGHFGIAYQLGLKALRGAGLPSPVPYRLPPNKPLFEAGKGLAFCLKELGKPAMAREVLEQLLRLDPSDPLALAAMHGELVGLLDSADEDDAGKS